MKPRAVVFAYHNVGVRCLQVLLARGVDDGNQCVRSSSHHRTRTTVPGS